MPRMGEHHPEQTIRPNGMAGSRSARELLRPQRFFLRGSVQRVAWPNSTSPTAVLENGNQQDRCTLDEPHRFERQWPTVDRAP